MSCSQKFLSDYAEDFSACTTDEKEAA